MWELITLFLINSIIAFFVFLTLIKIATMINPDFSFWLINRLEDMQDTLEEKQQKLEEERKTQEETDSKEDMSKETNKSGE